MAPFDPRYTQVGFNFISVQVCGMSIVSLLQQVRYGLDRLYKKVERHLCEEEGLIQVVWREMQDEFIQQYKCIEDLIQRCYPGAQVSLDFTIENVLEYFSDIARSH